MLPIAYRDEGCPLDRVSAGPPARCPPGRLSAAGRSKELPTPGPTWAGCPPKRLSTPRGSRKPAWGILAAKTRLALIPRNEKFRIAARAGLSQKRGPFSDKSRAGHPGSHPASRPRMTRWAGGLGSIRQPWRDGPVYRTFAQRSVRRYGQHTTSHFLSLCAQGCQGLYIVPVTWHATCSRPAQNS
jgi:hypothetical protein